MQYRFLGNAPGKLIHIYNKFKSVDFHLRICVNNISMKFAIFSDFHCVFSLFFALFSLCSVDLILLKEIWDLSNFNVPRQFPGCVNTKLIQCKILLPMYLRNLPIFRSKLSEGEHLIEPIFKVTNIPIGYTENQHIYIYNYLMKPPWLNYD